MCLLLNACLRKEANITDLRRLNATVEALTFQHENINTVAQIIESGDSMVTFDLNNGFFRVPVHHDDQQFLGFQFRSKWYVRTVLPFGLCASPYFFHKLLRPVVRFLREQGIRLVLYVDDCLVLAPAASATDHRDFVLQTFLELGFTINYEKSDLNPSVRKEFIGYIVDSMGPRDLPWVYIGDKKIKKLKKDIRRALTTGRVYARFLAKIAGQAVAMTKAITPGELKLRSWYSLLATKTLQFLKRQLSTLTGGYMLLIIGMVLHYRFLQWTHRSGRMLATLAGVVCVLILKRLEHGTQTLSTNI